MFEHPTGPRWAVCGENADQIDSRKYTRATKRDTSCGTFVGSHRRFEALFRRGHCGVGSALTLLIFFATENERNGFGHQVRNGCIRGVVFFPRGLHREFSLGQVPPQARSTLLSGSSNCSADRTMALALNSSRIKDSLSRRTFGRFSFSASVANRSILSA
jgi:hypothetical protein